METINRVANGQIDTDSDTLSAPSPPPHFKSGDASSPHKSGNHPKLKKAWLQRHSDEDKELKNSPFPQGDNSQTKSEILKNCYVNCSYISPSKEGGSRSPISALRLNGNIKDISNDDESTTSASETESAQVSYYSNYSFTLFVLITHMRFYLTPDTCICSHVFVRYV